MVWFSKLYHLPYPHGYEIWKVSYFWSELPDDVKSNGEDHDEWVNRVVESKLGRGFWLSGPVLGTGGEWSGIYVPLRRSIPPNPDESGASKRPTAPAMETPVDEDYQ